MDISIFLAQVFGLYFVIAGVAMLVRPNAISTLIETLGTRSSIYLTGFFVLMLGIPLVLIHNVWDGSWRVIITIMAWLALLKGVARIFFPDMVVGWAQGLARNPGMVKLMIWIMVVLGLYLLYIGFGYAADTQDSMRGRMGFQQNFSQINYSVPDPIDYVSVRPGVAALPNEDISQAEKDGLLFMREEEKLARDVYMTLYEKWGLPIFANIAQSEQTHTEAVRSLLVKYDIADPVIDDSVGVFVNSELQKLYDDLTAQGLGSPEGALTVGAIIEDLDISDLEVQIGLTDNEDIALVYENLLRGSRNHLRAFTRQLAMNGESYEPQYISHSEYDEIIATNRETGSGSGMGRGGRGWGNRI